MIGFGPFRERVTDLPTTKGTRMIITGLILMLIALLLDIGILYTIGGILIVVGAILWILGAVGRQVGPRIHYY